MSAGSFELKGRKFHLPAALTGAALEETDRLIGGLTVANSRHHYGDLYTYSLEPGAVELDLVRGGTCPLLLEHGRVFENLLGVVHDAWVEHGTLMSVARMATGGWADRVWSMLADSMPLATSTGTSILDAEDIGEAPEGGRHYRVLRWRLTELSIVVHGADPDAHVAQLDPVTRAKFAERVKTAAADRRAAVRSQLRLDRWERWATTTGIAIAEDLGVDRDALCDALDERVAAHCERLIGDLAG